MKLGSPALAQTEAVLEVCQDVVSVAEAGSAPELDVVAIERVRYDAPLRAADVDQKREIVRVAVAVVLEPLFLDQQAAGMIARAVATVPAGQPPAGGLLERGYREPDVLALDLLAEGEYFFRAIAQLPRFFLWIGPFRADLFCRGLILHERQRKCAK